MAAFSGCIPVAGSHAAQIEPDNNFVRIKYERAMGYRAAARTGDHIMGNKPNGHPRGRSHVATGLMAVVGTGVVVGLGLGYSERPVGLCVLAVAGLVVVLLCLTVLRGQLASLLTTLAGRHGAHFVQGPVVRVGLWVLMLLASLVAVLWPVTLPWSLFAALALLGSIAAVELLRLHPEFGVKEIASDEAKGRRWAWGGLSGLCAAWFMALVPGQVVHVFGGPVAEAPSTMLANAIGDFEARIMVRLASIDTRLARIENHLFMAGTTEESGFDPASLTAQQLEVLHEAENSLDPLMQLRAAIIRHETDAAKEMEREALRDHEISRVSGDREDRERVFQLRQAQGHLRLISGAHREAIVPYRQALALEPNDPFVLNGLAVALLGAKHNADHGDAMREAEVLLTLAAEGFAEHDPVPTLHVAKVLSNLASAKSGLGKLSEAVALHEQVRTMLPGRLDETHSLNIASLNQYASALANVGRPYAAEDVCTEAWRLAQKAGNASPRVRILTLNNLAMMRLRIGRYQDAKALQEDAMALGAEFLGAESADMAVLLNNMAAGTLSREADPGTLATLEQAVSISARCWGWGHPKTVACQLNFAMQLLDQDRADEALSIAQAALSTSRGLYEGDHPSTAIAMRVVGSAKLTLGDRIAAEDLGARALAMWRRMIDGDHDRILDTLLLLSAVHYDSDQHDRALDRAIEASDMARRIFRGDHDLVANALQNLGLALEKAGHTAQSAARRRECYEMRVRMFTGDHPLVAKSLWRLARANRKLGLHYTASHQASEAFDMALRLWEVDHPSVQEARIQKAMALMMIGEYEEAQVLVEDALQRLTVIHGGDHRDVADALNIAGSLMLSLESFERAQEYFTRAIEMERALPNTRKSALATHLNNLGFAYLQTQDYREAEANLQQAYTVLDSIRPRRPLYVAKATWALAMLYCRQERWDEARTSIQKAIRIRQGAIESDDKTLNGWRAVLVRLDQRSKDETFELPLVTSYQ